MTGAIIAAAGKGTRMRLGYSKQYINIDDMPVLAITTGIFEVCCSIDAVVLVVCEEDMDFCTTQIIKKYNYTKAVFVAAGGATRQESVYAGIKTLKSIFDNNSDNHIAVVHDGARPLVTVDLIDRCIFVCKDEVLKNGHGSICAAVPVKDTLRVSDSAINNISEADAIIYSSKTLDRSSIWSVQTPQVFDLGLLEAAHKKAIEDGYNGTDDTVLAERLGVKTRLVLGDYLNVKLTTAEDLDFARHLLMNKKGRNG